MARKPKSKPEAPASPCCGLNPDDFDHDPADDLDAPPWPGEEFGWEAAKALSLVPEPHKSDYIRAAQVAVLKGQPADDVARELISKAIDWCCGPAVFNECDRIAELETKAREAEQRARAPQAKGGKRRQAKAKAEREAWRAKAMELHGAGMPWPKVMHLCETMALEPEDKRRADLRFAELPPLAHQTFDGVARALWGTKSKSPDRRPKWASS
jgi:hypothetical protein